MSLAEQALLDEVKVVRTAYSPGARTRGDPSDEFAAQPRIIRGDPRCVPPRVPMPNRRLYRLRFHQQQEKGLFLLHPTLDPGGEAKFEPGKVAISRRTGE